MATTTPITIPTTVAVFVAEATECIFPSAEFIEGIALGDCTRVNTGVTTDTEYTVVVAILAGIVEDIYVEFSKILQHQ